MLSCFPTIAHRGKSKIKDLILILGTLHVAVKHDQKDHAPISGVYIIYICYIYSIYKYILHCYIVEQYTIISKTQVILPDFSSVLLMRAEYYIVKGERCKLKSESAPARKILSTMAASTPASKPER